MSSRKLRFSESYAVNKESLPPKTLANGQTFIVVGEDQTKVRDKPLLLELSPLLNYASKFKKSPVHTTPCVACSQIEKLVSLTPLKTLTISRIPRNADQRLKTAFSIPFW